MALRKKFGFLEKFDADILVIQEAEELPSNHFKNYHYQWFGKNANKGIGVLSKNLPYSIDQSFNENLVYYIPYAFDQFNLLNVWTHTGAKKLDLNGNADTIFALNYYSEWLASKNPSIIIGDFNNSVTFDHKPYWPSKFVDITRYLENLNFTSVYHSFFKEEFGQETLSTHYHQKNLQNTHHIDYAFIRGFDLTNIEVGKYEEWIDISDHMPLIIDVTELIK